MTKLEILKVIDNLNKAVESGTLTVVDAKKFAKRLTSMLNRNKTMKRIHRAFPQSTVGCDLLDSVVVSDRKFAK